MEPGRAAQARAVRAEDAFDVGAVARWLAAHAPEELHEELQEQPEVRQFAGGASNLTYLLRYPRRDLVLRRAPRGTKARGAHDMRREHALQQALRPSFRYVPTMVALCDDPAVLGADFYVMERLTGFIPRSDATTDELGPDQARALCLSMVEVLAELHAVDPAAAGRAGLGRGRGYVRRQVDGWSTRYRNARTADAPALEHVMAWLAAHQPDDVGSCVIHNDFKLDNLVLDDADHSRIVGVLDWEMATVGDPLMDLGGDLGYWVEAGDDPDFQQLRRVPTHLPGMLTREQLVSAYLDRTGRALGPGRWRFYEVFGLFRLAVISQQIYYRFFHRQTTNPLYAGFGPAVHVVDRRLRALL